MPPTLGSLHGKLCVVPNSPKTLLDDMTLAAFLSIESASDYPLEDSFHKEALKTVLIVMT